jgi:dienelactone hydrolase
MRRSQAVLTLLAVLAVAAAIPAAASAKIPKGPAGDAFYTPPSKLPGKRHGDLIWARKLTGGDVLSGARLNELVLYRSISSAGRPIAVSGTVSLPKGRPPKGGWPVITYAHGTTGIADACAPSRDTGALPLHSYNSYTFPLFERWLKRGYAVVRTDYQGLGTPGEHGYLIGVDEGRSTLDIVRAARGLDRRLSKRVVITGHSQGGHSALWAGALAPKWTPDLDVRGTVAYAPAAKLDDQVALIKALTQPSGLSGEIALILRGIDIAKPSLDIESILNDRPRELYPDTLTKCLSELGQSDSYGGIAPADIFRDGADLSAELAEIDKNDPEHLKIPARLLIEQGEADATVFKPVTDALVKDYKKNGTKVTYRTYKGVTHGGVVDAAAAHSTKFIAGLLRR